MTDGDNCLAPSDDVMREARTWVVRLQSGRVSQDDLEGLTRWRAVSAAHRRAFAEANLCWDVVRAAAQDVVATGDRVSLFAGGVLARRRMGRRAVLGGTAIAAASAIAYLAVRPPLDFWPPLSELTADYRTGTGEQRRVALGGGVSVEMNTRTSLSVGNAPAGARQIVLIAGEIAATTASTSFVVIAGGGQTSATQASFDLRRDGRKVTVACLDGVAEVVCAGDRVALQPHQQIVYDERGVSGIGSIEPNVVTGWRQGLLVFENQPLSQVIEEINRYRRGRIVLLNAELGRLPLDATFRLDEIDEVVPKIARVFGAKVRSLPGGIVFLS